MDANTAPSSEIRVEQKNVIVYFSLPFIIAIMTLIAWFFIVKKQGKMFNLNPRFVTTYIFLLFLIYPSVTQIMVDQFN